MPETLELETRVRIVEEELRSSSSAAASHFVELHEFFRDGQRSLTRQMQALSTRINDRFAKIDRRFEQIDRRFEQIDRRFEQIDRRFDRLEAKLDLFIRTQGGINRAFDRRLRRLEKRRPR